MFWEILKSFEELSHFIYFLNSVKFYIFNRTDQWSTPLAFNTSQSQIE